MARRFVRWFCALTVLLYGFAKLNGSQFTILDSELDKPMGHVSGFWLTWYYFGYSTVYGAFIALVQIGGAVLLTFRRTALLGACILAPVLANIVLIDLCFGVDLGATLVAFFLLCGMLSILAPHARDLGRLFFATQVDEARPSAAMSSAKWFARVAIVALACGFTYWVANYNNRAPSPIDGAWTVKSIEPAAAAERLPSTMYFEYNRAHMVVFKFRDGSYKTRHFEAGKTGGELKMWERWLRKGQELFAGSYDLSGPELRLTGGWREIGPVKLTLTQRLVR
jgi:hypothetical protein